MARIINPKGTIDKILTVSEKLFLENGFEKTSTQNIMDVTGISKGTIFHHFRSKEEILAAVMSRQFDKAERRIRGWLAEMGSLTAKEKITALFDRTFGNDSTSAIVLLAIEFQSPHMIVANLQDCVGRTAPIIAGLIREGAQDGSIITDFPDECAQVFLMLYNVWCDPVTLKCDTETLRRRMTFVQYTMKLWGVDVVSDEFIAKYLKFAERLCSGGTTNENNG